MNFTSLTQLKLPHAFHKNEGTLSEFCVMIFVQYNFAGSLLLKRQSHLQFNHALSSPLASTLISSECSSLLPEDLSS
jgi:hypothetical protein